MTILDWIQHWGLLKDMEILGAKERLAGAIIRLRRENPWSLQVPPRRKIEYPTDDE